MRPSVLNPLFADVTALPGVGPKIAALVGRVAGPRIVDVLLTPPIAVVDRRFTTRIADAPYGKLATLEVHVDSHQPSRVRRAPYKILCSDETGFLTLVFFHARDDYLQKLLPPGTRRLVSGKVEEFGGERQMTHPDHVADPDAPGSFQAVEPVYPLTAGLQPSVMRKASTGALARAPRVAEWQDAAFLAKNGWPDWATAIRRLHQPEAPEDLGFHTPHRARLAYDEFLANQLALLLVRRARVRAKGRRLVAPGALAAKARAALPFALTMAQERALGEILADMASEDRMVRLVQGDVGSGKTIVAFLAMLAAVEAGAQAALMAPTEILARQHLETLGPLAAAVGVRIDILTGRDKTRARGEKLASLASGDTQILIGTHALFQEDVGFRDLAFVVVDEQHRFGVHQRLALAAKGPRPDLLVMTATPIPRTLALTAYGDMDATAIAEKPPGRKPVATRVLPGDRLDDVVAAIGRAVAQGDQVYWVCPLVETSDVVPLVAAEQRYEELAARFGDKVGLVHGRMNAAEKDAVMEAFYEGRVAVLVATTVIEVGVNAPNATVMIVEHAEHFGLAQLHQLRGRVGRGAKPATCLLLYQPPLSETAKARLSILRETEDGFRIAEEDLRLRGAGDLIGAAQSGFPRFRLADVATQGELLAAARDDAKLIVAQDAKLAGDRGRALRALLYLFGRDDAVKLLSAG
ncbi:MAG: ATP-dependent DNA helicase RecG [Parvularculaceae bacterium]|nr:ATP-dependent DNA helicase RecG [Parvularculaceae bacterium]